MVKDYRSSPIIILNNIVLYAVQDISFRTFSPADFL